MKLIITRGLPGSGKTTRARAWVNDQAGARVRVNRDDLRRMMFGGRTGWDEHEEAVSAAQRAAVRALLLAGYDVVVDDTNLRPEFVQALSDIGREVGANVWVWDMTNVPVEACIARDAARAARGEPAVGEAVIREMYAEYLAATSEGTRS